MNWRKTCYHAYSNASMVFEFLRANILIILTSGISFEALIGSFLFIFLSQSITRAFRTNGRDFFIKKVIVHAFAKLKYIAMY